MKSMEYFVKVHTFVAASRWRAVVRWLMVAVGFSAGSIFLLSAFVEALHVPLTLATLLSAEVATVLRYFVTNRWVFDKRAATWQGLWQFHCANAAAFAIWWAITNLLSYYGLHYLIAATAAIAGSS